MPAARPLKRRATPGSGPADPPSDHAFQLTFASPSSLRSQLPSVHSSQGALVLQPTISFAPNVTPGTFEAPPPSDEDLLIAEGDSSHTTLFPDTDGQDNSLPNPPAAKRRRKAVPASASRATPVPSRASSRKAASKLSTASAKAGSPAPSHDSDSTSSVNSTDAPAHIPRPPNAFILFRSSFIRSQHISAQTEGNHGTLSKIVGMLWHALSYEERQFWQAKARRAYAEHKKMYPGYSFRPSKDKSSSNNPSVNSSKSDREGTPASSSDAPVLKRKTRAVGPRDLERCEHIAALLARGLKGSALDAAMKEFDASRKPQTITPRFEAPLTAQAYAGSKELKEKVKDELKEVKAETEEKEESRAATVEPLERVVQTKPQMENVTRMHAPSTVDLRPRRVRRSSSAPLLDAGFPISAPAPVYPATNTHFLQSQQQSQTFQYSHLYGQNEAPLHFDQSINVQNGQYSMYTPSSAYPHPQSQPSHSQEMIGLRKRSASSSPRLRRPSYSFGYSQFPSELFGDQLTNPYPHDDLAQEPQPLSHAYRPAHPHLQQMQAQMQSQVQAQMQSQPEDHSSSIGLGLEFDQSTQQSVYNAGGGLSRQSTLTDISTEESGSEAGANGYWNGSVDFSSFSFSAPNDSQTQICAHPSNPGPFEAPSSASVDELQGGYADMPDLVDAPLYHFFEPTGRASQPPQLEIQTSWSADEFSFDPEPASAASVPPPSAVDVESVPPSAVSGVFDFPPSSTGLNIQNGYLDYPSAAPTPCSPASQSTSGATSSAGVSTPNDESYGPWDQGCSTPAAAASSPATGYDSCSPTTVDDDALTRARALALQAGFRAYLAHAEKMGAMESANTEGAFEQFVSFVQDQSVAVGGGGGGMGGRNGFGGERETQAQMANVM